MISDSPVSARSAHGEKKQAAAAPASPRSRKRRSSDSRETAASRIAGDKDRSFDLGAQRAPSRHGVIEGGGESVLRGEAIIGREDEETAPGETAGDRPMRPRGHGGIAAAVQVEHRPERAEVLLGRRPFARHAAERAAREAHASGRERRRGGESLAHVERRSAGGKPRLDQRADRQIEKRGAQIGAGHGEGSKDEIGEPSHRKLKEIAPTWRRPPLTRAVRPPAPCSFPKAWRIPDRRRRA